MEATHKKQRFLKEHMARKTSIKDNLVDQFRHDWASGDPFVRLLDRTKSCSRCDQDGHWTVSCPTKALTVQIIDLSDRTDSDVVESVILQDGEAEPEDQKALWNSIVQNWRT